jgi:hypothetical protein
MDSIRKLAYDMGFKPPPNFYASLTFGEILSGIYRLPGFRVGRTLARLCPGQQTIRTLRRSLGISTEGATQLMWVVLSLETYNTVRKFGLGRALRYRRVKAELRTYLERRSNGRTENQRASD